MERLVFVQNEQTAKTYTNTYTLSAIKQTWCIPLPTQSDKSVKEYTGVRPVY